MRPRLWGQIKSLETNLHICSQLIYDIGNIEVQWKEGELFNKLQLCGCMEKTNVNLYLVPDTNNCFNVDKGTKYKRQNNEALRRKQKIIFMTLS